MTRLPLVALLSVVGLAFISGATGEEKQEATKATEWGPPSDLRGEGYKPAKRPKLPGDLANWDALYLLDDDVQRVRLVGFIPYNAGSPVDAEFKDAIVLRTIQDGLWPGSATRPAVSDISKSGGAAGIGAYLGVLEVKTKKERLIVGVSRVGFFLGVYHGSSRQQFHSWILAKQTDELLFKATGKHLEKDVFEALSGEAVINRSKKRYEDIRRDTGKDSKP
jgi:hypothetical protein